MAFTESRSTRDQKSWLWSCFRPQDAQNLPRIDRDGSRAALPAAVHHGWNLPSTRTPPGGVLGAWFGFCRVQNSEYPLQ